MSALGQKQTSALQKTMSALPPIATAKADIGHNWDRPKLQRAPHLTFAPIGCETIDPRLAKSAASARGALKIEATAVRPHSCVRGSHLNRRESLNRSCHRRLLVPTSIPTLDVGMVADDCNRRRAMRTWKTYDCRSFDGRRRMKKNNELAERESAVSHVAERR